MSVLTIEETKKRHKELWMWIAEETRRRKKKVDIDDFFDEHKEYEKPLAYSWCCEFAEDIQDAIIFAKNPLDFDFHPLDCNFCPIEKWGEKAIRNDCSCKGSLSLKWRLEVGETDWHKATDLAKQIANLPFKKAFDITPEQAKMLRDKGYGEIYSTEEISNGD